MLAGTGLLIQDDREAVLTPGDLAVYDTDRPYSLVFDEDFRTMVVMFPKHLLSLPPEMVGQLTAVRHLRPGGPGRHGGAVPAQLATNLDQLAGATGPACPQRPRPRLHRVHARARPRRRLADPHRALMQRIRGHIDRNLASTDLGPASIAAALHLDPAPARAVPGAGHEVSTWIRTAGSSSAGATC
jgi:hypothetical protein